MRKRRVLISGILFVVLVAALLAISFITQPMRPRPGPVTNEQKPQDQAAPAQSETPAPMEQAKGTVVKLQTNKGDITIELFDTQAPITAGNFLGLVKSGFYDGLKFHRVEPGFVIQGGDPNGNGSGGPGWTIPNEVSPDLKHDRGILSMARTSKPDTGGSQFFICTGGPEAVGQLDMGYSVFGRVLEGMPVVDKIVPGDKMIKLTVVKQSPDAAAAMATAKAARKPAAN